MTVSIFTAMMTMEQYTLLQNQKQYVMQLHNVFTPKDTSSGNKRGRATIPLTELTRGDIVVDKCPNPNNEKGHLMSPINDRIVMPYNESMTYDEQKIPRTIHVAWIREFF